MRIFAGIRPSVLLPLLRRGLSLKNLPAGSCFERFWRPLFGYAVSLTWILHMLTICWVVWMDNPRAPEIIMALVDTTSLWSVALGVFGISVVKNASEQQTPNNQPTEQPIQKKGEINGRSF